VQPFSESRYTSNAWLGPIAEQAQDVFKQLSREAAIEVAAALLKTTDTGTVDIPWATVFPSDDKTQIGGRLLQAPDHETPVFDPDTYLAVKELQNLLNKHDAVGMLGKHAAYHLVQAAAGKQENFLTYQDLGRRWS
jgi:hypothetical protein